MRYSGHKDYKAHQPTSSFIKGLSRSLADYMEEARKTLVKVLDNYKNLYGKSEMD